MSIQPSQQLNLPWWDEDPAVPAAPVQTPPAVLPPGVAAMPGAAMAHEGQSPLRGPAVVPSDPHASRETIGSSIASQAVFKHPHATHDIKLGDVLVAFELKRLKRRSIGMLVGPDGLSVRAPRWVGLVDIHQALREKSRWICAKLREQRELQQRQEAARIDWKEGASIPVLGEPAILVLDSRVHGVRLCDDAQALPGVARRTLHVGLPEHASAEQIRDTVNAWLQRQALEVFEARVAHFAQALSVNVRSVKLSNAKTRWGSATSNGDIRLHWRLIQFSQAIIDYVVAHELAHLREMNHSPRFWEVVASVVPEYERAKVHLRSAVMQD